VVCKADGSVVLTARGDKGMYIIKPIESKERDLPHRPIAMKSLSHPVTLEQWHRRLSHCSPLTIREMAGGNLVDGLELSDSALQGKCEDCILGRQTRRPFDGSTEKNLQPLELVSFDLWGPSRVQSGGGKTYFLPIIDGGTSFKHGAYLTDKSDSSTISAFNMFRSRAESVTGRKIQRLHTDRAYDSTAWRDYCQRHGIIHELMAPYSSAQNGFIRSKASLRGRRSFPVMWSSKKVTRITHHRVWGKTYLSLIPYLMRTRHSMRAKRLTQIPVRNNIKAARKIPEIKISSITSITSIATLPPLVGNLRKIGPLVCNHFLNHPNHGVLLEHHIPRQPASNRKNTSNERQQDGT
jgi:hypothetical protein